MVHVKVFLFTGIVFVLLSSLSALKSAPQQCSPQRSACPPTQCENMNLPTLIKYLWKVPEGISQAGEEYKTELIRLAKEVTRRPVEDRIRINALVLLLSLWAVVSYAGLVLPASPSCVFNGLVESTLSGCPTEQEKAVDEFVKLCILATDSSVRSGMKSAECPVDEITKDDTKFDTCELSDASFKSILEHHDSELPPSLKPLLENLNKSTSPVDVGISVGAVGSATKLSIDIFAKIMESDELIQVARFKACPEKIPPNCCPKRLKELTVAAENLNAVFVNL